jgi:hypothetical protein
MKSIYLVYKTDTWHSYNSRDLIGVATTAKIAITLIKRKAKQEGHPFRPSNDDHKWQLDFCAEKQQTQGYEGEGEFVWEEISKNTLL